MTLYAYIDLSILIANISESLLVPVVSPWCAYFFSVLGLAWFKLKINWPQLEKTCHRGFANNTGADQPAHPRSLINAFVIRILKRIICKLATGEVSTF